MIAAEAKKVKIALVAIFFLFILAFSLWRSADLIFGVKIRNVNLENGAVTTESALEVKGNARNALNLTLNGREIPIDISGNFTETVALLPGYNIVSIRATDKFGYVDEKNYYLILKQ